MLQNCIIRARVPLRLCIACHGVKFHNPGGFTFVPTNMGVADNSRLAYAAWHAQDSCLPRDLLNSGWMEVNSSERESL
jgi:hypothetical protein